MAKRGGARHKACMTDMRALKKQFRTEALARRDALDPQFRIEAALTLAEAADRFDIAPGTVVSGFFPIKSEMDLRPLMFALGAAGARLCLPVIVDRQWIVFRELVRTAPLVEVARRTLVERSSKSPDFDDTIDDTTTPAKQPPAAPSPAHN